MEPANGECWYGITDPKKRKQLQDRLAQRARRKRLAEAKNQLVDTSNQSTATSSKTAPSYSRREGSRHATEQPEQTTSSDQSESAPQSTEIQDLVPYSRRNLSSSTAFPSSSITPFSPCPDPETHFLNLPCFTVYAALTINGQVLGIPCIISLQSTSEPVQAATTPASLHPTPSQLTMVHSRFIDRFPFPRMRDNMIALTGLLDEEDFMADLFLMKSFTIRPGTEAWEPRGWAMGEEFKAKWGFLFV